MRELLGVPTVSLLQKYTLVEVITNTSGYKGPLGLSLLFRKPHQTKLNQPYSVRFVTLSMSFHCFTTRMLPIFLSVTVTVVEDTLFFSMKSLLVPPPLSRTRVFLPAYKMSNPRSFL